MLRRCLTDLGPKVEIVMNRREIIFIGNARCYHTMDWYKLVKALCPNRTVTIATDLIESEGYSRIITCDDNLIVLFNNDPLLLRQQTMFGNLWRNFIKLVTLPIVVVRLKQLFRQRNDAIFHAHSMYYIFLCWAAKIKYIATPMGSDVLVRPDRSSVYKYFTIRALRAAQVITVDSVALQNKIYDLCQANSVVVQNGIDTKAIASVLAKCAERVRVISIRGMDQNYRIYDLVQARNSSICQFDLEFIYPYMEAGYRENVRSIMVGGDIDHGCVKRTEMYRLFAETLLAVSIPESDSSPRTVYEAIFCGCCVAVTYATWIGALPDCMRARLYLVDLNNSHWFDEAIEFAKRVTANPYIPSRLALEIYDQEEAMKMVCNTIYGRESECFA